MTSGEAVHGRRFQFRKALRSGFTYFVMIFLAVIFLFPIVFMLITSLKVDEMQIMSDISTLYAFIPRGELGLDNYRDVFENLEFGRMLFNSTFVMVVTVVLGLVVNSMIAYALSRLSFKGRGLLLAIVVALIIVPFEAVAVPLLLVVNNLPWFGGATTWLDTYHVQNIPFNSDAFSIFLFYHFFISIPKELEEAALVDGAGRFRIYWQVVVPLSKPVFATVAILTALANWNRFMWPLMVTRGVDVRPLTVGMQTFFGQDPRIWGDLLAFASLITIPVLLEYLPVNNDAR